MALSLILPQLTYVIYLRKCPVSILITHVLPRQITFTSKPQDLKYEKKCLFKTIAAKLWNEIPSSLRELPKKLFKLRIKNKLLSCPEDKDSFTKVHKIISKLKSQ